MSIFSRFRSTDPTPRERPADEPVELTPAEFLRRRGPDATVLDVRTAAEFAAAHLDGAIHVDMLDDEFVDRVAALGLDRAAPLYLYCRSGNRSGHAARILRGHGYGRAFNVGGLDELAREGAPTAS
jgi:phage shock protein E